MTDTDTTESIRAEMVKNVVADCLLDGSVLTHDEVAARLPKDFAYSPDLDDYRRHASAEVPPQSPGVVGTLVIAEPGDTVVEPPAVVVEAQASLQAEHARLESKAAELRADIVREGSILQRARAALGQAISDMNHKIGPKISDAQLRRDAIASSNAERANKMRGQRGTVPTPGPSQVDRTAMYSGNAVGDANDHVRANMRNGGYRRGAFGAHMRGARLPSQR